MDAPARCWVMCCFDIFRRAVPGHHRRITGRKRFDFEKFSLVSLECARLLTFVELQDVDLKSMKMLQRMRILEEKGQDFAELELRDLPIIGERQFPEGGLRGRLRGGCEGGHRGGC